MTTQEIKKLKKVDEIMFNLQDSRDSQKKLLQAGELLKKLNLIDDQTDTDEIIQAYTRNVHEQLDKIIKRETVSFNQATLKYLQKDPDDNELVITPAKEHFKEYALIVLRFNDQISPEMKKRIKSLIVNKYWDRTSYHFLSQAVIFLDIDNAKELVDRAYSAYRKHPAIDTFIIQFVALIAVNYLNCCYHQHADKSYALSTFKFLKDLPPEPAIGLNKLLGLFYEAIFDNNQEKIARLRHVIGDCGYAAVIDDIKV